MITPSPDLQPKYRPDIDGLRGVAVMAVVLFHAFPSWVKGGFIGVDVFFVISGYLISTIIFQNLKADTFSFIDFYARRIRRIFPALILVLFVCLAIGWFALIPNEYKQLGLHIAGAAGFVSNWILWGEAGYFDNAAESKPLLHLWSLAIEEQFYIVWPLLLWLSWKRNFNFITILIILGSLSFFLNIKGVKENSISTFYSSQTRFWELLLGSLLSYLALYRKNAFKNVQKKVNEFASALIYRDKNEYNQNIFPSILSFIGFFLLIYGFYRINKDLAFPGSWALVPVLASILIISAGEQSWINKRVLSNKIAVWFGLISYPLYLWHWPILSFARIINGAALSVQVSVAAVLLSIVLAWLTYRLVERPIKAVVNKLRLVLILLLFMMGIGLLALICYRLDGYGFRYPKELSELSIYKYDVAGEWRQHTCFLEVPDNFTQFQKCNDHLSPNKDSLFLWGDSHAASLYQGYKTFYSEQFNIIQRTTSICPPILDLDSEANLNCKKNNDYIFDSIRMKKPKIVILSAAWPNYFDWFSDRDRGGELTSKIRDTVSRLKVIGIPEIYIIGPFPQWHEPLPKQLFLFYKTNFYLGRIPRRMNFGLKENFMRYDLYLSDLSRILGVNYISPRDILCNDDGCITMLGDAPETIVTYDNSHLTSIGSRYLVSHFYKVKR